MYTVHVMIHRKGTRRFNSLIEAEINVPSRSKIRIYCFIILFTRYDVSVRQIVLTLLFCGEFRNQTTPKYQNPTWVKKIVVVYLV